MTSDGQDKPENNRWTSSAIQNRLIDPHIGQGFAVHPTLRGKEASLLEALLGSTDYGILIADAATRQDLLCNARFGELFGLDPDETVRISPELARERILPRIENPEDFLEDLHSVYSQPRLVRTDELKLQNPEQVLQRYTAPLFNEAGDQLGRVWTFLDITLVKRFRLQSERQTMDLEQLVNERTRQIQAMQEQLIDQEKLAAVGLLAASVAHHLRNILTPLTVELSAPLPRDEASSDIVPLLQQQIQRLTTLTHQLLSLSNPPRLEVAHADLRSIWQNVEPNLRTQADQFGCVLETHLSVAPVPVEVNREQMEQVFVNLSMNALAAMAHTGGMLRVEIGSKEGLALAGFTDTGPGLREEIASQLFRPFVSGQPGGTGLGLYSCRRIAQEHGGNVTLEEAKPGRTKFVVRLPLLDRLTHTDLSVFPGVRNER